jgi:hypothetical protein
MTTSPRGMGTVRKPDTPSGPPVGCPAGQDFSKPREASYTSVHQQRWLKPVRCIRATGSIPKSRVGLTSEVCLFHNLYDRPPAACVCASSQRPLSNYTCACANSPFPLHAARSSPEGTLQGAPIHFILKFPLDYPQRQPEVRLLQAIPHPNLQRVDIQVCACREGREGPSLDAR